MQSASGTNRGQVGVAPRGDGQSPADALADAAAHALESVRRRFLDLRTMTWPLRLTVLAAFATLLAIGVVLAVGGSTGQMIIDHQEGRDVQVPSAVFFVGLVGLGLVWVVLLTAALHSPWYIRFSALLFFTFWALLEDATGFPVGANPAARVNDTVSTALLVQFAILAGLWLRAIIISILNLRAGRAGRSLKSERAAASTLFLLIVALAAHYYFGYQASAAAGNGPNDLTFSAMINIELGFLFILLTPALFIAGTDFAEAGQTIATTVAGILGRRGSPVLLLLLTLLLTLALTGFGVYVFLGDTSFGPLKLISSPDLLVQAIAVATGFLLVVGLIVALLAWGLTWLATVTFGLRRWPTAEIPVWGLLAATVVLGIGFGILTLLTVAGLPLIMAVIVPILGLLVGVPLALRGRTQPGPASVTGLYIILASTVGILAYAWAFSGQPTLIVLTAPASLIALLWQLIRRGVAGSATLAARLFVLNVGIVAISISYEIFRRGHANGQAFGVVAAVTLVGAFVWDLLSSGGKGANLDGRRLRRFVRVFLAVGYALFAATAALFFTSETFVGGGAPSILSALNGETIARVGLLFLGVPLLMTYAILGFSTKTKQSGYVSENSAPTWPDVANMYRPRM